MPRLPPEARIDWTDESAPRASAFDDVYFSRAGGLAEARAVFLDGCGLPSLWQGKQRFSICELGFGSGLNVLAAWDAWNRTRGPDAVLHISTIEAFPLAGADAARALAHFPALEHLSAQLLARWPVRAPAPQRLWFDNDRVALTVHIGEAENVLTSLRGRFDVWFLDGFAPARNPAMWSDAVFQRMAALSAPGARAATFSVAGEVRRGLERAGFRVEKKPGFGNKRERLEASFAGGTPHEVRAAPQRVAIIGAGIAGAATAAALGRRGVKAVVLDAGVALGAGASGNPAGLVMPRLDRGGALAEVFLASYLNAVATYQALGVFEPCGIEERARAANADALADLLQDPPLTDDWYSALPNGAAFHPRAGLVRPLAAIEQWLTGAELLLESEIAAIERAGEGWVLRAPDGRARLKADAVVLACGAGLAAFAPASFLPIALSRGQIEWGPAAPPPHAITQSNYLAPFDGGVLFGATFDKLQHLAPVTESAESRAENIAALARLAPEIAASLHLAALSSRAALRATTRDRAPIAGALPDAANWPGAWHSGVYVLGGLGARGLTLAPLMGETIASAIYDEPQALSQFALNAIDPARFLQRRAKRAG